LSKKLDEAIAAMLAASKPAGCWGSRLTGDAKAFMAACIETEGKGIKVDRTETRALLANTFDVTIGEERFREHLLGRCSCD
jgi:hypothetical protein